MQLCEPSLALMDVIYMYAQDECEEHYKGHSRVRGGACTEVGGAYYLHMHDEGFSNDFITKLYYGDATIDVTNVIRSCITHWSNYGGLEKSKFGVKYLLRMVIEMGVEWWSQIRHFSEIYPK